MTPPGRLSLRLASLVGALGAAGPGAFGAMAHWNLGRELEARERENLQLKLGADPPQPGRRSRPAQRPAVQAHALQDQLVAQAACT